MDGDSGTDPVRAYYAAIDDGAYDRLRSVLTADFVHDRSDRTLDGRERFVRFMREDRPRTDTVHTLDSVCARAADAGTETFVRGRLLTEDGEELFGFVDVHRVAEGQIERLVTYTH
jgi:ketosteroid isomerase-like protein